MLHRYSSLISKSKTQLLCVVCTDRGIETEYSSEYSWFRVSGFEFGIFSKVSYVYIPIMNCYFKRPGRVGIETRSAEHERTRVA